MKVGFVYDPIHFKHDTGQHPENASRLEAVMSHLEQTGLKQRLTAIKPRRATMKELCLAHDEPYISFIREAAQRGDGWLDASTVISSGSYEAALHAAGGTLEAAETVINGRLDRTFALVRPPGHHATTRQAMGFCLFNNLAIAAKYALTERNLERIAIIDFDVHHGNGTQDIFYHDPQVLYISTHQYPHFPGTGSLEETGCGPARGTTINIPLRNGSSDDEYRQAFEQIVVPATRRFAPQLILVSAGYDCHWADELSLMQVSVSGYARMTEMITGLSEELCSGKLVFSLEGGYNVNALAASIKATFEVLFGQTDIEDPLGPTRYPWSAPIVTPLLKTLKETHNLS
ncbi:MAG: histone deacetylase [Dehalococcoidales bacterium]|nr:histone deacetylase [Dehalococcoidales bacterium]